MPARLSVAARRLFQDSRELMRGHDLALASAGAALYGALCVVPSILVAVSLAQLVLGPDRLHRYGGELAHALPSAIGADAAAERLVTPRVVPTPPRGLFPPVLGSGDGGGGRSA